MTIVSVEGGGPALAMIRAVVIGMFLPGRRPVCRGLMGLEPAQLLCFS
jgi:hypothetical protein